MGGHTGPPLQKKPRLNNCGQLLLVSGQGFLYTAYSRCQIIFTAFVFEIAP